MPIKQSDNFDNDGMTLRKILMNQAGAMSGTTPTTTQPAQVSSAPSSSAPQTAAADQTIAPGSRMYIQNLSTTPLYVRRGTGATTSVFNYALKGSTAIDDGTGGIIDITDYNGVVSFASATVRYVAWTR